MSEEFRKYNSDIETKAMNIRLTKDAEVKGDNFVKLTFAAESTGEMDATMWWDVIPFDGQAPIASFLKKGDIISVTGRPTLQKWGDDDAKFSLTLKNARLHLDPNLVAELKERGFVPGSKSTGGGAKPGAKGKAPPPKAAGKGKRPVVNLDDDE